MNVFGTNNPGLGGLVELTASELLFIQNLSGLSYSEGDVLYHDGNNLINLGIGPNGTVLTSNGTIPQWAGVAGTGDVVGPASSTDNAVARFDGTGGKVIQNSGVVIDDSDNIAGVSSISLDGSTSGTLGILVPATITSYNITLPNAQGALNQVLVNDGSGNLTWQDQSGAGSGEANTASNVNVDGLGVFKQKTGVDLEFYGINIGSNKLSIALDAPNNTIDLDVVEANINILSLSGSPSSTVVGISDSQTLTNKTINADNNTITNIGSSEITADIITGLTEEIVPTSGDFILGYDTSSLALRKFNVGNLPGSGGGESNTASNVNIGGVGVFKQKTGVNLEFKGINAGSNKISITDDIGNNEVDVDVVEANVNINNLSGAPTGSVVGTTDAQTLTNKTINGATLNGVIIGINATSFSLPTSATPTVDSNGEIALDTTVADFSHGILKYFGGEELGIVSMPVAQFTTPTNGYVVSYNATNDEFELVPQSGGDISISPQTADPVNILDSNSTTFYTNEGSAGLINFNLPTAVAGLTYTFYVQTAQTVQVNAGTGDTVRLGNTVSAAAGNIASNIVGNLVKLTAINATEWVAEYAVGNWTIT